MRSTILGAALLVVSMGPEASACSCKEPSPGEVIFIGTVTAVAPRTDADGHVENVVQFRVDDITRGVEGTEAAVVTPGEGSDCGVEFVPERQYEVHAWTSGGELRTNQCSCTGEIGSLPACGGGDGGCSTAPRSTHTRFDVAGALLFCLAVFCVRRSKAARTA